MRTDGGAIGVGGRLGQIRRSLTPSQWRSLAGMAAVVGGLHLTGFFLLLAVVAPHRYDLGTTGGVFTVGVGITAYTLGMRHAFDADHIAAIDNTTRKLMSDGQRPLSAGFYFSLGHSTIVFALAFLFAAGVRVLSRQVENDGSLLHDVTGWIGTGVSGVFLSIIGILNLLILIGIVRVFRDMRTGTIDDHELEERLNSRGAMSRVYGRFAHAVTKPWQMYPIGVLFGLGFDTATEVALLFLAAGAAGAGLPFYAILTLPILFAAGMSLLDTLDGCFMNFAYGWAFASPVRKIYYNITVTGLSVAVALVIGVIELAGITAERLQATGSFWIWVEGIDLNTLGLVIVAMFVATWAVSLAVWHFGRIEERWSVKPRRNV